MEYIKDPRRIEEKSMEMIEELLREYNLDRWQKPVVKRIVHTTGDPSFAEITVIGNNAAQAGARRLAAGGRVYCDVEMVRSGINRKTTAALGLDLQCTIHKPEIANAAKMGGITRAAAAMEAALAEQPMNGIFVIGNAPTALFVLLEAVTAGRARPALVVGTPVGFVGAAESKEWLTTFDFPWITVRGQKGGSTIAAAIINALLTLTPDC